MNLFGNHSDCTRCHRKYHHDLMMVTKIDHLCIRCFNVKKKEKEYEKEKTNALQSNDHSENQKVA
jgi:hypothetical protein